MHDNTNAGKLHAVSVARFQQILRDIATERGRQEAKWGEQNHDFASWQPILLEELGEMNRAFLKATFAEVEAEGARREGQPVDERSIPERRAEFRKEAIQTAAVMLAMIECGDRNNWWGPTDGAQQS